MSVTGAGENKKTPLGKLKLDHCTTIDGHTQKGMVIAHGKITGGVTGDVDVATLTSSDGKLIDSNTTRSDGGHTIISGDNSGGIRQFDLPAGGNFEMPRPTSQADVDRVNKVTAACRAKLGIPGAP